MTSLFTTSDPRAASEAGFLRWLRGVRTSAPRRRDATAVLVPFRAHAYELKALALDAGDGLLGVHFLTPAELRTRLVRHLDREASVPPPAHRRLLISIAAERCGHAAAADPLLNAIDLLAAGGWRFDEAGPAPLRPIVREFERLAGAAGFRSAPDIDRALFDRAPGAAPLFADFFVAGFNALHWPLWPLLSAAVRCAESATVLLSDPRAEAADLDATWVGAWEERFGPACPLDAEESPRPFIDLLLIPESKSEAARRAAHPAASVEFLVAENTLEEARAVAAKVIHFLADPACERLGVLFPAAGALSRRVAELLADCGVPHHDGLAHPAPGPLEGAAFAAWIELQRSPRLPALVRLLRVLPQPDRLFHGVPPDAVEGALTRAFGELLIDDLAALAEHLARHPRRRDAGALAAGLRALPFLPGRATIGGFIARTEEIFLTLGWTAHTAELRRLADDWRLAAAPEVSREAWLRWLGETLVSWRPVRAEAGAHPYSRVHLLPAAQAESQAWTHLIVAGLNEGHWPPRHDESGFFGEEEITALNGRVRMLNMRATTQGRYGEGHATVQPGKALVLGPAERRALVQRQFLNTIESTSVAVAACAQLFDESAPERRLNPGDFFTRLYFCARGRAISQATMDELRSETARWLDAGALPPAPAPDLSGVQATRIAHDARRDPAQPFGEYEFAWRTPPSPVLRLSATDWERAFKDPASVWMEHSLGIVARDANEETPWNLALGVWVHDWLRAISGGGAPFAALPPPEEIRARIRDAAAAFRSRVREILHRPLPDWWQSTWEQAMPLAETLGERIGSVSGRTHAATEYALPRGTGVSLADGAQLFVHGRIDLILTSGPSIEDAWIVDYKTGDRKPLTAKRLRAGDGLQLALYALALRENGARTAGVSLLTPALSLDAPQLTLADLDAQAPLWRGLHWMQESGVFGMRGALREEFGFRADYPLATLAIDEAVLEEKWERSHVEFNGQGEE